jgi:hypothetical protein
MWSECLLCCLKLRRLGICHVIGWRVLCPPGSRLLPTFLYLLYTILPICFKSALKMEATYPSETMIVYLPSSPHGVTTQKTDFDIFTAFRTSNLIHKINCKQNIYNWRNFQNKPESQNKTQTALQSLFQTICRASRIWGSHGGESEDVCLLGSGRWVMMEATSTSETLVNFYQTTRRYNPEDSHLPICRALDSSRSKRTCSLACKTALQLRWASLYSAIEKKSILDSVK